jgi:hypothetical protein
VNFLLLIGIICLIAAVVGGGLKLAGMEIPLLRSIRRQLLLALVGLAAAVIGVTFPDLGSSPSTSATADDPKVGAIAEAPQASAVPEGPKADVVAERPTITADPDRGVAGITIVVSGSGFAPYEQVRFNFAGGSATASGSCSGPDCSYSASSSGYAAGSTNGTCSGSGSGCGGSAIASSCSGGPLKDIPADGTGAFRDELLIPAVPETANVDLACLLEAVGLSSQLKADTPFHITVK